MPANEAQGWVLLQPSHWETTGLALAGQGTEKAELDPSLRVGDESVRSLVWDTYFTVVHI